MNRSITEFPVPIDALIAARARGVVIRIVLEQQDNDLLVIHDATTVASFAASFERIWDRGVPISDASVRSE